IAFGIKRAFDDRLVLDGSLLVPTPNDLKLDRGTPRDYTLVAQCFQNMLMTFEVRTRNAYVVLGKDPISFQHRVIANGSGRCQVDAKQSPLLSGVAYEDVPFRNAFVAFRIASLRNASGAVLRTRPGTTLGLALSSNTPKLVLDATSTTYDRLHGVLPVDLRYNDVDQTLYMVDMSARGLITIPLDGFPAAIGSSYE
ncbi:MAG TPA: hypothetical protein VHM19_08995, partial [Polyangiales bacterium]|nr:hypothetical protein [Polyangiales bacterium]